jgi:hypothetical protein
LSGRCDDLLAKVITTLDAAGIKIDAGEALPIAKLLNDTLLEQNGVLGFGM